MAQDFDKHKNANPDARQARKAFKQNQPIDCYAKN
jgi:hypothetical protein